MLTSLDAWKVEIYYGFEATMHLLYKYHQSKYAAPKYLYNNVLLLDLKQATTTKTERFYFSLWKNQSAPNVNIGQRSFFYWAVNWENL